MKLIHLVTCVFLLMGCAAPKSITITIQPDGNKMAYLTKEFRVSSGQEVTLVMNNTATSPAMKHNILILSDSKKVQEVGQLSMKEADYIPDHPAIIASTPMANPGEQTQVTFTAPSKGEYTYICTFPGHYFMMQGTMIVE